MAVNHTSDVRYALQYGQKFPTNQVLNLTEPVVIKNMDGPPRIEPDVPGKRVQFLFDGVGDAPFIYQDSRDMYFAHADVFLAVPCEAAFIFERRTVGAGIIPITHAMLRDVRIYGNSLGKRGIWFRVPVSDQNNEHARLDDVTVYYVAQEALRIDGSQAKEHVLTNFRCEGTQYGIVSNSGSFTMLGGALHLCSAAAVQLNNPTGAVTMIGVASETSKRFLVKTSATGDAQPIQLINCTVMTDQLHADGVCIDVRSGGPLSIQGGQLGDGAGQGHAKINFQPLGTGLLRLHDVVWKSFGSFEVKDTLISVSASSILRQDACFFTRASGALANQYET